MLTFSQRVGQFGINYAKWKAEKKEKETLAKDIVKDESDILEQLSFLEEENENESTKVTKQ